MLTVLLSLIFKSVLAANAGEVLIYNTFAPKGFDSNDHATVSVAGALPNTCYHSPRAQVEQVGRKVTVSVSAHYRQSERCTKVKVPFLSLTVVESQGQAVDDYIYAHVEYIDENDFDRGIVLVGSNPSDCLELERVEFVSNGRDTLAVLPIMKQVQDHCPAKEVPFRYEVDVPKVLSREIIMLHVRTMNGLAVNYLYKNDFNKLFSSGK
jgi:hypothetical protein